MFTAQDIQAAHSQVKSGADFPAYIHAIKALGVTHYEAYVADGHIDYHGAGAHTATVPPKYPPLQVADHPDVASFQANLKAHQQGQTTYLTFIADCAAAGIEKWAIDMQAMTCTYFDKAGRVVLVEEIPA